LCIILDNTSTQFDIIILVEAWLGRDNIISENYQLPNYSVCYTRSNKNQNDGIMVFIKNQLTMISTLELQTKSQTVLEIQVKKWCTSFLIYAIYRSPNNDVELFLNELQYTVLEKAKQINADFKILIGDINLDILRTSIISNKYLDLLAEFGYYKLINTITRQASNSCLDHIFMKSNTIKYVKPIVSQITITDHYPILLSIGNLISNRKNTPHPLTITKIDHYMFSNLILNQSWNTILAHTDVNHATECFINTLKDIIKLSSVSFKISSKLKKIKPWATTELIKAIRDRDLLHLKIKKHNANDKLKNYYKNFRNKVTQLIRNAKNKYYKSELEKANGNPKMSWKLINKFIGRGHKQNIMKNTILHDGIELNLKENSQIISNKFNDFFINVASDLLTKLKKQQNEIHNLDILSDDHIPSKSIVNQFILTNEREIINQITKLKNDSSPGLDGITVNLLKENKSTLANPLKHIFNLSLSNAIIPDLFKLSIITPIFKKGETNLINNYRPISMISNIAKILEKIIKDRLVTFLETNNIIHKSQYGFQKGKGTDQAIAEVTQFIYKTLDESKKCATVYLDLAKAFDTVDHNILLLKLNKIGLRNEALQLFSSYLNNRKQCVKINESISSLCLVKCGVPQGTVVSPILFNIQLNGIHSLPLKSQLVCYADDTVMLCSGDSWDEIFNIIQLDLKLIKNWLTKNNLFLNLEKTCVVPHALIDSMLPTETKIKVHNIHCVQINNCLCESINIGYNFKYLGIEISSNMRWMNHIDLLTKKLRKMMYILRNLNKVLELPKLRQIYLALVESIISYGIIGWGGVFDNTLSQLQICQNQIIRSLLNKERMYPTRNLYTELNVLPVRKLYFKITAIFLKSHNLLQPIMHGINTRYAKNNFLIKKTKKTTTSRYFEVIGINLCNKIPSEIITLPVNLFKKRILQWMLESHDELII